MNTPKNAFEIFFLEAAQDPSKEAEFYVWVARQTFFVPCQDLMTSTRQVFVTVGAQVRLKAFPQKTPEGERSVFPFFSDLRRFETWSAPDPQGQYVEVPGKMFFGLITPGSAALLNPGSEELSKWFSPEEVKRVLTPVTPTAGQ